MDKVLKKKLVIFDVDGTLMDSEGDVFLCFNHTLKDNVNFEITREQFQKMAGLSLEKVFEGVLPEKDKYLANDLTKKFRQYYIDEKHFLDTTVLFDGVKETISNLKKQGFIIVIASSKPKRALDYMVEYFNLAEFDLVLGTGESNFKHKPDPEIIYYVLNKFNILKEYAVIVGDSQADVLAGKNAKIDTIALTYGYDSRENLKKLNPTFLIDDFKVINDILKYEKEGGQK